MALHIVEPDVEARIREHADAQPTKTSKTRMATAILDRATKDDPDTLRKWLLSDPAINRAREHAATPPTTTD